MYREPSTKAPSPWEVCCRSLQSLSKLRDQNGVQDPYRNSHLQRGMFSHDSAQHIHIQTVWDQAYIGYDSFANSRYFMERSEGTKVPLLHKPLLSYIEFEYSKCNWWARPSFTLGQDSICALLRLKSSITIHTWRTITGEVLWSASNVITGLGHFGVTDFKTVSRISLLALVFKIHLITTDIRSDIQLKTYDMNIC